MGRENGCHIINLEEGLPTAEVARGLLSQAVRMAKAVGTKSLKIIHGYGSSGKGGALKRETHRFLRQKCAEGVIRGYIPGEAFSPFSEETRQAVAKYPHLARDSDYSKGNDGITIVLL